MQLVTSIWDWRNLVSMAAWGVLTMLLWLVCACGSSSAFLRDGILNPWRRSRRWRLLIALALLIVPFLPASHALIKVGFVLAERQLIIPSLGAVLLVVELVAFATELGAASTSSVGVNGHEGYSSDDRYEIVVAPCVTSR